MKNGSVYVLGTGLSHDGSACLLKDGQIVVAIEKERLTRVKHDGGNDTIAINYCLEAAGITLPDLDLVVQNDNFSNLDFGNDFYQGPRLFSDSADVPVVTISHHLAHAYSTIGTCPFDTFTILVIDGCGSSFDDCTDLTGGCIPDRHLITPEVKHLFCEKDSYYSYRNSECKPIYKDFSEYGYALKNYPIYPNTTKHSIGGLYSAVSRYCFGNLDDPGKLMGLGPYGRPGTFTDELFELRDGRVFVNYDWMTAFRKPALSYDGFKRNFQYYADMAYWVQREVERAILYVIKSRLDMAPTNHLCYAGGVALNAVANAKIIAETSVRHLYMQPAAGDNGLAIGCAYYGWLETLKQERRLHNQSTCFGIRYPQTQVKKLLDDYLVVQNPMATQTLVDAFFEQLPLHNNWSDLPDQRTVLQVNVEPCGVYQVRIENGKLTSVPTVKHAPTHSIKLTGDTLVRCLFVPGYASVARQNRKINGADDSTWAWFRQFLSDPDLIASLRSIGLATDGCGPVVYQQTPNYVEQTAQLLADGQVIGWFQEASEFGPRALGRRSILADPRRENVRDFINARIKFREDFRPFAPSVLAEEAANYFKHNHPSPYMILVDQVRPEWQDTLKSVMHVDQSARVQTVTPDWNPTYHQLLGAFKEKTGISVLLNTSFNRKGMPIVETPLDALDFFYSCELDYLVLGDCVISKK